MEASFHKPPDKTLSRRAALARVPRVRHTSVCSGATCEGREGLGARTPAPPAGLRLPPSTLQAVAEGSLRKMPPEPSGLAEPKGGNPLSLDFTSFPLPEVSETDLPSLETAGPHSCESSNRGTREARGRRRDCLMQSVSHGLCHFKTL